AERKLALILSDYPTRGGRTGFAVGLDTPASVCSILDELRATGYAAPRDFNGIALMRELTSGDAKLTLSLDRYRAWLNTLPSALRTDLTAASGTPEDDRAVRQGSFHFKAIRSGNVLIAVQPERAGGGDRKASYHDLALPPAHAYLAFYLLLREIERVH